MSRHVLVTGGAGYIGSHACKALARAGFVPVALDNLVHGRREFVRWGPLVVGNVSDTAAVAAALERFSVEAVMHFAAFAFVGESVQDPAKYYQNNVIGTLALLDAMRETGCDRIVFSSSCAVYGTPDVVPISERAPTSPVNPYGRSKLICEQAIRDYGSAYGLASVILRYFNASGADEDGELGEDRDVETHLIPRAFLAILGRIRDFEVFGADYPTLDGTAVRDYIHVSDLATAHVLALKQLVQSSRSGTYNLGTGRGYSVAEILNAIERLTGEALRTPRGSRRPGDPAELVADPTLAGRELGFTPTRSDLQAIVESSWRWHRKTHPRLPA